MKAQYVRLSDQLRRIIAEGDKSRYRIWRETGVAQETLCRFMAGGGLSMEALDKVGEYLGLRIVADKPQKKTKGR
jgi:hypothetical protein